MNSHFKLVPLNAIASARQMIRVDLPLKYLP